MNYQLALSSEAEQELDAHIKAGNKQLLKKIFSLFEELQQHPKMGTGRPKPLKYQQAGLWSRRIDDDIITVFILALWGHYNDK
jgi:Uncharacterized protein conserved in bacteria